MTSVVYVEEVPVKVRFRSDCAILSVCGYVFSRVKCWHISVENVEKEFFNNKEKILEILENQLKYKIERLSLVENTIKDLNTLEKIKVLKEVL